MRVPRFTPWLLVLTLTAAGAAAALGYGLTAPKRYRSTAQILATPEGQTRVREGVMKIVGAVYELESGNIRFLD